MDRAQAQARARALVEQMTLEEQASQLRYDAPAIPRLGVPAYNWWNEALHGVARAGVATILVKPIRLAGNPGRYLRYAVEVPFRLLSRGGEKL